MEAILGRGRDMSDSIQEAWKLLHAGKHVVAPPGRVVQQMLPWDSPYYWDDTYGEHWHYWQFVPVMMSGGPNILRIKQTIIMHATGPHEVRKHEAVLAVHSSDIADLGRMKFPGPDFGGSFSVPTLFGESTIHASVPAALTFGLNRPVPVRRFREYPLSRGPEESEVLVTEFPLWMPNQDVVLQVEALVQQWVQGARSASQGHQSGMSSQSVEAPRFEDFPVTPPGSIRREF